ncbi:MAG TPA: SPOR domain-containing protein [Rhizomicrobium sp.]|jgi:cell division septation protein DedD|nr:SPOR domain-containing protein [Rhizomicrobium sp.]
MANLERHAYEADDIHGFDDDENGTEEPSRLPLLIVIALVVLASFAGVVWLAYTQGVERGREDAPRVAAAAQAPSPAPKVPSPPYTGLNIYQQPMPATGNSTNTDKAAPTPLPPVAASAASSAPPALRPASANTEKPAPAPAVPAAPSSASRLSTVASSPALRPPVAPGTSPAASVASVPGTPVAAVASPTVRGEIFLQIGSYKSDAEARESWIGFRTRHAIAAGYRPDVKAADLGAKGKWYRLRLGPFADKQSAASFCEKLRAGGANCLVAK